MTRINIQSISDLITNSSTEVFVVYDRQAVEEVKDMVSSILSLVDPSKTFDDYFEIDLRVNYDLMDTVLNNLDSDKYPEAAEYKKAEGVDEETKIMDAIPDERIEELFEAYNDSHWAYLRPYEGIRVIPKVDDPVVDKVAGVIAGIGNIFQLDYSSDY